MSVDPVLEQVAARIQARSQKNRDDYLALMQQMQGGEIQRETLSCSNLAHGVAVLSESEKQQFIAKKWRNVGIVTAYNDMLSAHQPYAQYPDKIKALLKPHAISAQVAGGVPAMCDGVTQGQPGMELSLFSRDEIARSTAIALSHQMFDAAVLLGICDKIVPGLLIGALKFGYLPTILLPAGPMPSGLSNTKKSEVRQAYAEGKVDAAALLSMEMQCYHTSGTCTFYGTANTNQMLMEFMGLHLPGASFVNPGTPLRQALDKKALDLLVEQMQAAQPKRLYEVVTEYSLVNAIVGLLATGGSTNLTIHLIAIAKACGLTITWQDFADLAQRVPLLTRVYPNGSADVNAFHAQGGIPFCIRELLEAGLLFPQVQTAFGMAYTEYAQQPAWVDEALQWQALPPGRQDNPIVRPYTAPFQATGGLSVLSGNLGQAVVKTSAVKPDYWSITAPAYVFDDQLELKAAFQRGELTQDFVAVVRYQGPRANGMPELHQLMPILGSLQDNGIRVALVTDGRLSGASGKVLCAIQTTPEACAQGGLARIRQGDTITLDVAKGVLEARVPEETWAQRVPMTPDLSRYHRGVGRDLFEMMRQHCSEATTGATTF